MLTNVPQINVGVAQVLTTVERLDTMFKDQPAGVADLFAVFHDAVQAADAAPEGVNVLSPDLAKYTKITDAQRESLIFVARNRNPQARRTFIELSLLARQGTLSEMLRTYRERITTLIDKLEVAEKKVKS
jgi:hypothetical protein